MTIVELNDGFDRAIFNLKAPHPLQSWEWGEARKKTGINVYRFGEYDEKEELKNVFTITLHRLPYLKHSIGYVPRSVWPSQSMLKHLYDWGQNKRIIFIKFEPDVAVNFQESNPREGYHLTTSPHPLFPRFTQVVDLTVTEEILMQQLKPKTRYNIKLAQKKGVIVKECSNDEGFSIFQKLYFETCKRQHYHGHTHEYHRIVWESMRGGIAHILIAFLGDEPLAAYELFHFHDKLYYPYGGSSERNRNVMAPNLLMWEAIKLGKAFGARSFDMWGSLPPQKSENVTDSQSKEGWQGFSRFKEGYGTYYQEFVGSYDMILSSLYYNLYSLGYKLRSLML